MKLLRNCLMLPLVLLFLPAFGSGERLFAPRADLWERWTAHDPNSTATIDHGGWDRFLERYVRPNASGVNLVDYLGVSKSDTASLDAYLDDMSAIVISDHNRDEQMAYWINLYNALTVDLILENLPLDSIRDIKSGGFFSAGPWDKDVIEVEGEALTLNDIEHRILRPIWRDPRIHYAVNCASIGCPNLGVKAYRAETIDDALGDAARAYINDPRGVKVANGLVTVSKIYDWFIEDFGGNETGVIRHLREYAAPGLLTALDNSEGLDDTHYDWSINVVR